MMRIWPDSLLGRTVVVLLAGLLVSNLAGLAIYGVDHGNTVSTGRADALAGRIAVAAKAMQDSIAEGRPPQRLRSYGPGLWGRWSANSPLVTNPGDPRTAAELRLALQSGMGDLEVRDIRVAPGPPPLQLGGGDRYRDRDRRGWGGGRSAGQSTGMYGAIDSDGRPAVATSPTIGGATSEGPADAMVNVSLQLTGGEWLDFSVFSPPVPPFWAAGHMVPLILSTLFVMAVSLWAVWRAAKPLNLFTEAAERLGRDVNAPNLPETGPGDVRRAAQAFNLMQERLRAFVNDRTQMLAAISHDLRTPITRIQLRTEFIDDEEIRLKILLDLKEMETMIAATLAFARDEAMAEERTAFDLAAVLRSLCDAAATGPAKAAFDGPDTLTIVAGPVGIRRLFANLIGNAVTFGHTALVSAQVEGETVLVNVDDEGPGIPDAEMGAVFRPFYRLERSRNRETGGVGLGLAIARSIARAHGGDVTLVNRPEGGLRATVRLPALSVASAAA